MTVFNVPNLHILRRILITYTQLLCSAELKLTQLFNVHHDSSVEGLRFGTEYEVKDEDAALEQEHQPVRVRYPVLQCWGSGSSVADPDPGPF